MPKKHIRSTKAKRSPPTLSRETFDLHWLTHRPTSKDYKRLSHYPLREISGSRNQIRDCLSQALIDHHMNRQRLADRLATLGYEGVAQFIKSELPRDDRTRKGNFGEIVASEHLIQRHGYTMPVFKIRFRDSYNMPMRGEDIVAFEMDAKNHIKSVIIGEAKTIQRFRRATLKHAHERLRIAYRPRPMTLSMLAEILYDRGNDTFALEIDRVSDRLMKRAFPRSNWIFMITERQARDAFRILEEEDDLVPNLNCVSLALEELTEFINDLFDNPIP